MVLTLPGKYPTRLAGNDGKDTGELDVEAETMIDPQGGRV